MNINITKETEDALSSIAKKHNKTVDYLVEEAMQRGGYKLLPCGITFRTGRKLASVRTSLQGSSLVLYCSQGRTSDAENP